MGFLTKVERRSGVKMADEFIPEGAIFEGTLPRTNYSYRRDIREGLDSNVVMAPVFWISRNFTQAKPVVERLTSGIWEPLDDHSLTNILRRPNPFYGGNLLWKATVVSLCLDGNGYWQKLRNRFGEVIGFWYLPHFLVEPKWPHDGSVFISHYEYRPLTGGDSIDLAVRDVVHFRYEGLDPRNSRKGLSPLKMLLREVFTDEEASNFSASILRNMGVPGGVMAPKDSSARISDPDVARMSAFMQGFTGDRRGQWFVSKVPTELHQFGFDPNQLLLANLRDISEERVCAVLGIPAAVVGFGAGLQQTKVGATMRENRQSAWHNAIIPMQDDIGEQATFQLIGDFHAQTRRFRMGFDRSMVSAFQEEETERAKRICLYVEKGLLRVDQGQELAGLEVDDSQAIYLRPSGVTPIAAGGGGGAGPEDEKQLADAIAARLAPSGRNGGGGES